MRVGEGGFFHLTYCTNIHPGEHWPEVFDALQVYAVALKARLSPDRPFGIGLRLSDVATRELLTDDRLQRFKAWLDETGLYVYTINGFPYGGFHRQVVKDQVYAPDWRTRERLEYALRLAQILATLLPAGMDGGISTSPISYKPWLDAQEQEEARKLGALHLIRLTDELARLRDRTGKLIHVDLEPEPHCLVENLDETVRFFEDCLWPLAANDAAVYDLREHIGVCYDTCHAAVEYERPEDVIARLAASGIKLGKVQLSAALRVQLPPSPDARCRLGEQLQPLAESTYLHQTLERTAAGTLRHYADLPDALAKLMVTDGTEWRIHYHVPIVHDRFAGLESTQPDLVTALAELRRTRACPHLEIETYTWDVLPPELRTNLLDSIHGEYRWVLAQFGQQG